jgi:hypothetical protein
LEKSLQSCWRSSESPWGDLSARTFSTACRFLKVSQQSPPLCLSAGIMMGVTNAQLAAEREKKLKSLSQEGREKFLAEEAAAKAHDEAKSRSVFVALSYCQWLLALHHHHHPYHFSIISSLDHF